VVKKGFTLIEVLITITIISLVAGLIYPSLHKMTQSFEREISKKKEIMKERIKDFCLFVSGTDNCLNGNLQKGKTVAIQHR